MPFVDDDRSNPSIQLPGCIDQYPTRAVARRKRSQPPSCSHGDLRMVEKFVAEVFGTAILILLGDGVVAGVLLAKSKAQVGQERK